MRVLYVELDDQDRESLEALVVNTTTSEGRLVSRSEVVRRLIRDAAKKELAQRLKRR